MPTKGELSHHLIRVCSADIFDDRTTSTIENQSGDRQTLIDHLLSDEVSSGLK